MIVVAPRIGCDNAAQRVIAIGRGQVELVIVDREDDDRVEGAVFAVCQQRRMASLVEVARQVAHLAGARRGHPRVIEIGMGCRSNGQHATVVKAKAACFAFDQMGKGERIHTIILTRGRASVNSAG